MIDDSFRNVTEALPLNGKFFTPNKTYGDEAIHFYITPNTSQEKPPIIWYAKLYIDRGMNAKKLERKINKLQKKMLAVTKMLNETYED